MAATAAGESKQSCGREEQVVAGERHLGECSAERASEAGMLAWAARSSYVRSLLKKLRKAQIAYVNWSRRTAP